MDFFKIKLAKPKGAPPPKRKGRPLMLARKYRNQPRAVVSLSHEVLFDSPDTCV